MVLAWLALGQGDTAYVYEYHARGMIRIEYTKEGKKERVKSSHGVQVRPQRTFPLLSGFPISFPFLSLSLSLCFLELHNGAGYTRLDRTAFFCDLLAGGGGL